MTNWPRGSTRSSVGESPHGSGSAGQRTRRDDGDAPTPRFFFGGGMLYDAIYLSVRRGTEGTAGTQGNRAVLRWRRPRQQDVAFAARLKRRSARIPLCTASTLPPSARRRRVAKMAAGAGGGYPAVEGIRVVAIPAVATGWRLSGWWLPGAVSGWRTSARAGEHSAPEQDGWKEDFAADCERNRRTIL